MIRALDAGADVGVVIRNNFGSAVDVAQFVLIAIVTDFVICAPYVEYEDNDGNIIVCQGKDDTLVYCAKETVEDFDAKLLVFPVADCYETLDLAKDALHKTRYT